MDEVTKQRQQREDAGAGVGADGVRRYIEIDSSGKAWITTASHDEHGRANPPLTADAIRRHLPETAEALRAQGAERARAKHGTAADPEAAQKAAADERARIQSILDLPHAKGRESLATQLALTEGMAVDKAAELLAVAPVEHAYTDGVLASEPTDEARDAADHAVRAAREGGYIR